MKSEVLLKLAIPISNTIKSRFKGPVDSSQSKHEQPLLSQATSGHRHTLETYMKSIYKKKDFPIFIRHKMNSVLDQIASALEQNDIDLVFHALLSNDLILNYVGFANPDPAILDFFPTIIEKAIRGDHENSAWFVKAILQALHP